MSDVEFEEYHGLREAYIDGKPARDVEEINEDQIDGRELCMYCVMRRDLEMSPGKLAAMAGHAFVDCAFRYIKQRKQMGVIYFDKYQRAGQTKIVLAVNSLSELVRVRDLAIAAFHTTATIVDEGRTVFKGVPTVTCFAVGPCKKSDLPEEFAKLELY